MTGFEAAVEYSLASKAKGEKRVSRHGLFHAVSQATGKTLGGSRALFERIAKAVGGTYVVKFRSGRSRGYIYL